MLLLLTMWCTPSDIRFLSWLWLTSFPILPKAGWTAADRSSSMGEEVWPGVEHSHHRRGHRGGRLPAAHRYCWTHRSNTPPPSHAFLCILSCHWSNRWQWFTISLMVIETVGVNFILLYSAPCCCTFVSLTSSSVHGYTFHRFPLPIRNFLFLLGNE